MWNKDIRDGVYVSEHTWTLAIIASDVMGVPILNYVDLSNDSDKE